MNDPEQRLVVSDHPCHFVVVYGPRAISVELSSPRLVFRVRGGRLCSPLRFSCSSLGPPAFIVVWPFFKNGVDIDFGRPQVLVRSSSPFHELCNLVLVASHFLSEQLTHPAREARISSYNALCLNMALAQMYLFCSRALGMVILSSTSVHI